MNVERMIAAASLAVGVVVGGIVVAANDAKQPTQEEMMAAWQKIATPGPDHKVLENYVGHWSAKVTMQMDPSQPAEVNDGTSDGELVLGGRFVQVVHHGTAMGMPFEGRMTLGYDNLSKKYVSSWVDNMGTGIYHYEGKYDAATKELRMEASFLDPMSGKPTHSRAVTKFVDAGTMTYDEWFPGPTGKEVHGLSITFKKS